MVHGGSGRDLRARTLPSRIVHRRRCICATVARFPRVPPPLCSVGSPHARAARAGSTATMEAAPLPAPPPENCPGTSSEAAGKAAACAGCPNQSACAQAPKGPDPDVAAIVERMRHIKHKLLVLSGKGGVGKSTVSAQLAYALAAAGNQVGLLDIDICGPSLPRMLGLEGEEVHQSSSGWSPVYVSDSLGVMSIGFMLTDPNEAVVWRGPRKNGLIKQFLKDVDWGTLDYLVVDAPPGTSDEHISITQYLRECGVDGAVVVTTPQEVALADVRKELSFCKKVGLRVLGVVENMSGLKIALDKVQFRTAANVDVTDAVLQALRTVAPDGQQLYAHTEVFCSDSSGARDMAAAWSVPYLGAIPMDPELTRAGEAGQALPAHALASGAIADIVARIIAQCTTT